MKILIGMETSGKIREEFRTKGHDAVSCDILPSDDNSPHHHQCDIYDVLKTNHWDIIIIHPECTKLCVSGNHVYAFGKIKHMQRISAIQYTQRLWSNCLLWTEKLCLENPVGVLKTHTNLPKPQYIQPYQFGHNASKKTGLFLHGLPKLKETKRIYGRIYLSNGKRYERWSNQTDSGQNKLAPPKDRWKLRSETYQGIAEAMASQWG